MSRLLLAILLLFLSATVYGQREFDEGSGSEGGQMRSPKGDDSEEGDGKDTVVVNVDKYRLIGNFLNKEDLFIDTLLNDFHVDDLSLKENISIQNLGNIGSAYQSLSFYERPENRERGEYNSLFSKYYDAYTHKSASQPYYTTATPFTEMTYTQNFDNKPNENTLLSFLHTQNLTPFTNAGFQYRTRAADGDYNYQRQKTYFFNTFASHEGHRYSLYLAYAINHTSSEDNGGATDSDNLIDVNLEPSTIPVWLTGATSSNSGSFFTVTQRFKFGEWVDVELEDGSYEIFKSKFELSYTFDYARDQRKFYEDEALPESSITVGEETIDSLYYGPDHETNISDLTTSDYQGSKRFSNLVTLALKEDSTKRFTFSKSLYSGFDVMKYRYNDPNQAEPNDSTFTDVGEYNIFVGAVIGQSISDFWNWELEARYYPTGYKSQDFMLRGEMNKPIRGKKDTSMVTLHGGMYLREADFYEQNFYSNHYKWSSDLDKEYEVNVGGKFEKPLWNLDFGGDVSLYTNYLYWSDESTPEVLSSGASVFSIYLNKRFNIDDVLYSSFKTLFQQSTSDMINIPAFTINNNSYVQIMVAQVMQLHIGFNLRYNSSYYADAYSPAVGQFIVQRDEKIDTFLQLDPYLAFKLKRVRAFVRYNSVNQMWQDKVKNQTTLGYGQQPNALAFGFSWSFYD